MNLTAIHDIESWPVEERLDLVFGVWDRLVESGWRPEPTDELADELDRRLAAHAADPTNTRTWEQIEARLRKSE